MKQAIQKISRNYWGAIIASALAFCWIAFYTNHSGIGISPDSVAYLSTANHIANEFLWVDYNNQPLVNFPLGYPVFLALIKLISSTSILLAVPFVNSILFAAVLFLTSQLLQEISLKKWLLQLLALLLLVCSAPLIEVYTMLWSETLFILLVLLFLVYAKKYLQYPNYKWLITLALITTIAISVRYVGITLIITGVCLIIFNGSVNLKNRFFHTALFIIIGITIPFINLLRNSIKAGSYAGVRQAANRSVGDNINNFAEVMQNWFPIPNNITVSLIIILFLLISLIIAVVYRLLQQQFYPSYITVLTVFIIIYAGFMLFIASVSRFEPLSNRLLSPIYIPTVVLLFYASAWLIGKTKNYLKVFAVTIFLLYYGLAQYHQYQLNAVNWEGISYAGIPGYTEDQWTSSPILRYMQQHHTNYAATIYSNANDAVYFLANLKAYPLPHKDLPEEINSFMQQKKIYLVWFQYGQNPDLIDYTYISKHKKLAATWQFKDGSIFYFTEK